MKDFNDASKEATEYHGVDLLEIPEDDRLDEWPWSKKYLDKINADMGRGVLDSMLRMLDIIGVPRGCFADERLMNFIVMYNNRGDLINSLTQQINAKTRDEEIIALQYQIDTLKYVLIEIANWPIEKENKTAFQLKVAASSVIDPNEAPLLKPLLESKS